MSPLVSAVEALYESNRRRGHAAWCDRDYDFVCPSASRYPFQWFWDSCFHAVVLSHFDVDRARAEISCLLSQAQPDGFVPHVIFWEREAHAEVLRTYNIAYRTPYLSDHLQPPLLAEAIAAITERDPVGTAKWLGEVVQRATRFYDWLDRARDPDRDGLIAILQPDESGLDHSPKYDAYLGVEGAPVSLERFDAAWTRVAERHPRHGGDQTRRSFGNAAFVCEDVLVNTIYAENLAVLGALLRRTGDIEAAGRMAERSARTVRALVDKCWDPVRGLFFDLAGTDELSLAVNTVSSLMPLILEDLPENCVDALVAHLDNPSEFATRFPVPSVAVNEPSFSAAPIGERLLWRGGTWLNTNWYLVRGLRRHGREDLAQRIADASVELITQGGFREYYNPLTGEGYGANDFSWSALALDIQTSG